MRVCLYVLCDYCENWIIYVISVLFCYAFMHVLFVDALWSPAGKGLTFWLSFVVSNCEFVTFPLVSWVRLYRFLIFAPLLTSILEFKNEYGVYDTVSLVRLFIIKN